MKRSVQLSSLIPVYILVLCALIIAGFASSKAVSVIAENTPVTNRQCVVIDAGHGGIDGGATSCTGILESSLNLEISLRLDDLMHLLGIKTVMIRIADCSIYTEGESIAAKKASDLKQRVKIVNETDNAILISIHQNYFSDSRYSGAQVFYCNNKESKRLAQQLQTAFVQALNKGSNRQEKKSSGIYLMEHINTTGILVECGFLSNAEEEARLRDDIYQKKLCCVIAAISSQYLYSNNGIA